MCGSVRECVCASAPAHHPIRGLEHSQSKTRGDLRSNIPSGRREKGRRRDRALARRTSGRLPWKGIRKKLPWPRELLSGFSGFSTVKPQPKLSVLPTNPTGPGSAHEALRPVWEGGKSRPPGSSGRAPKSCTQPVAQGGARRGPSRIHGRPRARRVPPSPSLAYSPLMRRIQALAGPCVSLVVVW